MQIYKFSSRGQDAKHIENLFVLYEKIGIGGSTNKLHSMVSNSKSSSKPNTRSFGDK